MTHNEAKVVGNLLYAHRLVKAVLNRRDKCRKKTLEWIQRYEHCLPDDAVDELMKISLSSIVVPGSEANIFPYINEN